MNTILISDWEIFGIVALTSGLAIALGVFMTLYARAPRKKNNYTQENASISRTSLSSLDKIMNFIRGK